MKKVILTLVAIFAFGFANAQDKSSSFGLKGGLNMSTIKNNPDLNTLLSFHAGVFAEFMLSHKFGIQPEVLYSAQGGKNDGGEVNIDYINIPVMLKYFVIKGFSIEAGPQVGYLMSAKADGVDLKDTANSIDYGVNFGAGCNLSKKMVVGLRYNLGINDIQKDVDPGVDGPKNSVIQLSLGFKF